MPTPPFPRRRVKFPLLGDPFFSFTCRVPLSQTGTRRQVLSPSLHNFPFFPPQGPLFSSHPLAFLRFRGCFKFYPFLIALLARSFSARPHTTFRPLSLTFDRPDLLSPISPFPFQDAEIVQVSPFCRDQFPRPLVALFPWSPLFVFLRRKMPVHSFQNPETFFPPVSFPPFFCGKVAPYFPPQPTFLLGSRISFRDALIEVFDVSPLLRVPRTGILLGSCPGR